MDLREALYTTRSMRRLKPDPVPLDVQARILDAARFAPSGRNMQNWHFILVDDPQIAKVLGPIYREQIGAVLDSTYAEAARAAADDPDSPESRAIERLFRSVRHQALHWESIPLFLFAYAPEGNTGSSIFPAIWSAMLAARAEGVGSTLTTVLNPRKDVDRLLGVPEGEGWVQVACVPMGYPTGRFGVPERKPLASVAGRNSWSGPLGFDASEPLWPGDEL